MISRGLDMENKTFLCDKCDQKFQYKTNLYRHSRDTHGIDSRLHERPQYTCESCGFKCYQKKQLISHIRINHCSPKRKNRMKCSLCDVHVRSYRCLNQHISQIHDISVAEEKLEFKNETEFLTWKLNVEKETKNHYRAERGLRKQKNGSVREYVCHRSYTAVLKDTDRKRAPKVLGSNKIGAVCPSRIIVAIEPKKVSVNFVRRHVGHSDEVIRMRLFDHERAEIAEKAKKGFNVKRILKEARDSADPKSSTRFHNLKRKDIYNIIRDFSIDYAKAKANSRNENQNHETTESSSKDANCKNERDQIHEPTNPSDDDRGSDNWVDESESLFETIPHPDDTKSITGAELKVKLQQMLRLVDNIPTSDIEIVSEKLDELMVYFENRSLKTSSNCETSLQTKSGVELNGRCTIFFPPAEEGIYMNDISAIEEIEVEQVIFVD